MTKIKKVFRTIAGDRQLLFGCLGLMILLLVILFQGVLETHDPYEYGSDSLVGLGVNGHLLGTNKLGQDIFSMLIAGVSTSLKVALISSMISAIIGILIGGAAGFLGGKVDLVLSELINVFMMIPTFFLELMIIALFGNSIVNVMIVIGLTSWASNAKLMRAQALSLRERTFVKSAVVMGESQPQILFNYIIPNGIFPVIANTTDGRVRCDSDGGEPVLPGSGRCQRHLLGTDDLTTARAHITSARRILQRLPALPSSSL